MLGKEKHVRKSIYLPETLYKQIHAEAKRHDVSFAAVVRDMLENDLQRFKARHKARTKRGTKTGTTTN